jgi:GNAT superfamily N-acetyltransferase
MTFATRPARVADWPRLWPLMQAMGTGDPEDLVLKRFTDVVDGPWWRVVVVELDGELLGYAAAQDYGDHLRGGFDGRIARLHDVFVRPELRHQGVGRALVAAVEGWAAERVRYLQWQAHGTRAAPFYERLGHHGSPCPQPEYPEFEVDFGPRPSGVGRD